MFRIPAGRTWTALVALTLLAPAAPLGAQTRPARSSAFTEIKMGCLHVSISARESNGAGTGRGWSRRRHNCENPVERQDYARRSATVWPKGPMTAPAPPQD